MLYYVMKNKVFFILIIGFILIQFQSCSECGVGSYGGYLENKTNHFIKIVTINQNNIQNSCIIDSFQSLIYYFDRCTKPYAFHFSSEQPQFPRDFFLNADSVKVIFDDTYFYYLYKENDPTGIHSELGFKNVYRNSFFSHLTANKLLQS